MKLFLVFSFVLLAIVIVDAKRCVDCNGENGTNEECTCPVNYRRLYTYVHSVYCCSWDPETTAKPYTDGYDDGDRDARRKWISGQDPTEVPLFFESLDLWRNIQTNNQRIIEKATFSFKLTVLTSFCSWIKIQISSNSDDFLGSSMGWNLSNERQSWDKVNHGWLQRWKWNQQQRVSVSGRLNPYFSVAKQVRWDPLTASKFMMGFLPVIEMLTRKSSTSVFDVNAKDYELIQIRKVR